MFIPAAAAYVAAFIFLTYGILSKDEDNFYQRFSMGLLWLIVAQTFR